jgi:hypothetical protein
MKLYEHWAENIATSDENLSALNKLFQQSKLPSLGKAIFTVSTLHGPTGALFSVVTENDTVKIKRNEVEVSNNFTEDDVVKTSITTEALYDVKTQFGEDGIELLSNYLKGLANDFENTKVLDFLENNASSKDDLTLSGSSPDYVWQTISNHVTKLVLEMNMKNIRTYEAFVVLPYKLAASIMSLFADLHNSELADKTRLFVGRSGFTEWYINPDPNEETTVYVGLKDTNMEGRGCAHFSEYINTITYAVEPKNGESYCFIWDRFALTMNPSHTATNPMLVKFGVLQE